MKNAPKSATILSMSSRATVNRTAAHVVLTLRLEMHVNSPKSPSNRKFSGHENYSHREKKIIFVYATRYQAKKYKPNCCKGQISDCVLAQVFLTHARLPPSRVY